MSSSPAVTTCAPSSTSRARASVRLDWAPGQFLKSREGHVVCAAHGAAFELQGGLCVSGPCRGQSLHAVPVDVRAGQVVLV